MRILKKTLCLVLALLMALSTMTLVSAETAKAETEEVTGFTAEDFLTVKGRKMYNQKGEEVQLKGVNLGGWLIHEDWLCPDELPKGVQYDHETILEILEERFGREKAHELTKLYEENWITEYDLDIIKERGFNCVRVPF